MKGTNMHNNIADDRGFVLITGSNRGIGNATLKYFAEKGWDIIAHARKPTNEFENDIHKISEKHGVEIIPVCFDLTDSLAMKNEIQKIYKKKIYISGLVNCAGVAMFKFFPMMRMSEIKSIFDVNLFSCMELTQLVLKGMMKKKKGCIVNVSSIAGFDLQTNNAAYGVSKAALNAFTKDLSMELGQFHIRVNAVAPGIVDTDMLETTGEDNVNMLITGSAMKRAATPEEVAKVIYYLCSDEASYVNGQIIRVDGGMI